MSLRQWALHHGREVADSVGFTLFAYRLVTWIQYFRLLVASFSLLMLLFVANLRYWLGFYRIRRNDSIMFHISSSAHILLLTITFGW